MLSLEIGNSLQFVSFVDLVRLSEHGAHCLLRRTHLVVVVVCHCPGRLADFAQVVGLHPVGELASESFVSRCH